MAASRIIEQESGTYTGRRHPHNGYYAGDFSDRTYETRTIAALQARSANGPDAHGSWNRSQR
jgi:hypothetical protein